MKHTLKKLSLVIGLMALCSVGLFAQASLTYTTLSTAVTSTSQQYIVVNSATGITAPSLSAGTSTQLYIDTELMDVEAVNSTTISVRRGAGGTVAGAHASGSLIYAGPPQYFSTKGRSGYCVATSEVVLPVINVKSGEIYDCKTSVWERATQVNVATVALALRRSHNIVSLNYAGSTTLGSLSVAGDRGLAEIGSATTVTAGYVYGTEGKARVNGVLSGSAWVFGTIGQLDISNGTLTSGSHLGGVWSDAGATGPSVSCTFCDGVVVTNTTATTFNSAFYVYSKAGYLFDLNNNGSAFINSGTGSSGSITGYLKIKINGTDAYIAYKGTPGT